MKCDNNCAYYYSTDDSIEPYCHAEPDWFDPCSQTDDYYEDDEE